MIALYILAAIVGAFLLSVYVRSIVVVALLNSKSTDIVERTARKTAVAAVQRFIRTDASYEQSQRRQAWIMPLFILLAVVTWFLLVQLAFTGILWGLRIEPDFWRALSASGSALSTLGYLTPSSLIGEYLAVFQAAIGLAVVMLLFTFVPGYQTSVQVRERKVGWLYARADHEANSERYVQWLLANTEGVRHGWEDWEHWFRGIRETHTLSPILSYVPSIYPGTSWLATSSAVLDATSAITACLGPKTPAEVLICKHEGTVTMQLIADALGISQPKEVAASVPQPSIAPRFHGLYDALVKAGLPVVGDQAECLRNYEAMRAEYAPCIHLVAAATLTPMKRLDLSNRDRAQAEPPAL